MTKRLIATREVWYASKKHDAGDEFEASDVDATILCAHDVSGGARAKVKPAEPAKPVEKPRSIVEALAVKAEELKDDEGQPDAGEGGAPRRRYRRRDMTSEE